MTNYMYSLFSGILNFVLLVVAIVAAFVKENILKFRNIDHSGLRTDAKPLKSIVAKGVNYLRDFLSLLQHSPTVA